MGDIVKSLSDFLNEDMGPPQGPSIVTVPGNWGATYANSRNYHPLGVAQLPMVVDPLYNSEGIYSWLEFINANRKELEKGPKSFRARKKRKNRKTKK
jgi:hypothetical protein